MWGEHFVINFLLFWTKTMSSTKTYLDNYKNMTDIDWKIRYYPDHVNTWVYIFI